MNGKKINMKSNKFAKSIMELVIYEISHAHMEAVPSLSQLLSDYLFLDQYKLKLTCFYIISRLL